MSKLPYFILSVLCAVSQHEILASSDNSISSAESGITASTATSSAHNRPRRRMHHLGPPLTIQYILGPTPPAHAQSLRALSIDNPTNVGLSVGKTNYGHGLAIHPHFVVARPDQRRPGFEVSSFQDGKVEYFLVIDTFRKRGDNIILIETRAPIFLDNGHSEPNALFNQGYNTDEYNWARDYVNNWIETHISPSPTRQIRFRDD